MLHSNHKTFGLVFSIPFLLASNNPVDLSQVKTEEKARTVPPVEVQSVTIINSESLQLKVNTDPPQAEKKGKTKGRDYCDGVGVC